MMKKIILASCILLVGCTSNSEPEFVYDETAIAETTQPPVADYDRKPLRYATSSVKAQESGDVVATYPKYDIFRTLDRNNRQINKIYTETTTKVYLTADGEKIEKRQAMTEEEIEEEEPEVVEEHEDYTQDCVTYCGEGFFYSHNGELLNGNERICVKYPLPCGEQCLKEWYIQELIYDTNYTCQEAIQKDGNDEEQSETSEEKSERAPKQAEAEKK